MLGLKKLQLWGLVLLAPAALGCGDDETAPPPPSDGTPHVVSSTPAEGASDVDADATEAITITFSELMDTSAGSLDLEGAGTLGMPSWSGQILTIPVSGLQGETSYRITLNGFVDVTGVALDGARYLGDGALDFSTAAGGPDTIAPQAIASDPNEGQLDVALDLGSISVTFDEPMATATTAATLAGGSADIALSGSWDATGTTITYPLAAPLEYGTAYRVDLASYTDAAGNALDGAAYLGDGALDFVSIQNPDMQPPFAVSSTPAEGAFNLDPELQTVTVTFSEAMDATITAVPFSEGVSPPQMVSGVWSDGDTVFTVTFADYLKAGAVFHLDLTGMQDKAGNLLDAAHVYLANGILDFALANPNGESCNTPLVKSQAVLSAGAYTWTIAAGAVGSPDGQFGCDPNGAGADVVIKFTKTSDTVANGGSLLHVDAVGMNDDINLEITSGTCNAMTGVVEKCLWFKQSWGTFLDVPAGTYWIFVSDDDTSGGFPGATVTVEEIPTTAPQAQGEGCFAPYTTASSIYTPPAMSGDPHVWTIPATINGFDITNQTAAVGSISCDNHVTYGDIHGVDAVIEFQKAQSASSLFIEVNNLDPTLTQSDLDVEVLTGCNTLDTTSESKYCGADKDNFAFTAEAPAGSVYVWIATEATGEEFNGAEVKITEFTPAIGETRTNPEPLSSSGPINPTSGIGVDRPSCFPVSGNIHWYSYTSTGTLFGVQGDTAAPIAVVSSTGTEIACSTDSTVVAIGSRLTAGETVLVAVESPTAIANLNIIDQSYTGVGATVTDLQITFPVSAATEYSLAVGANEIFLGSTAEIWSFPKTGGATAVEHNTGEGLSSTHLGYDITFAGGKLFSIDTTTTTTTSRLYAVYDEPSNTWGPTAWDTPASYPSSTGFYTLTNDGTSLLFARRVTTTTGGGVTFYSVPVGSPATAVSLGTNTGIYYVTGLAADASYFYVVARDTVNLLEGLYRIDRSNIAAPALLLAPVDLNLTRTNVVVDNLSAANNIYVRDDANVLHAVASVSGTPIYLGGLLTKGGTADYAMGIDRSTNTVYMFDSTLGTTNGGIVAVQ